MVTGVHDLSIEQFRVRNYRVLRDITFGSISRLTVLCGPNGTLDRQGCLPKFRVAGAVARHMDVEGNRLRSFAQFRSGIRRLVDAERVA